MAMEHYDSKDRYQELARKWLEGSISPEEEKEFSDWYNRDQRDSIEVAAHLAKNESAHRSRLFKQIQWSVNKAKVATFLNRSNTAIAAAVVLAILSVGAFLAVYHHQQNIRTNNLAVREVGPGGDKATLTLSDGSVLVLDDHGNGVIRESDGLIISKVDGLLEYKTSRSGQQITEGFNTIETPRGGQFKLSLPDGSRVWLNSASSLRYPTTFAGDVRQVTLVGEAYFEVQHVGANQPFWVNVADKQKIEVLGTHFNVMAYPDELGIKTTLLEGRVSVSSYGTHGLSQKLKPGQQSVQTINGDIKVQEVMDIEESVAWKNGQIYFKDATIQSIMRQVSRWYDVEVAYRGNIGDRLFTGGISKNSNLSSLLKILELNDIHFVVEDRKIIVSP